jgi:hypothetical protein
MSCICCYSNEAPIHGIWGALVLIILPLTPILRGALTLVSPRVSRGVVSRDKVSRRKISRGIVSRGKVSRDKISRDILPYCRIECCQAACGRQNQEKFSHGSLLSLAAMYSFQSSFEIPGTECCRCRDFCHAIKNIWRLRSAYPVCAGDAS